ncbi:MAG: DNA ligase [Sulfuritalea sp.]|nr:DNA ligase [Sulfuritalea sp.]
MKFTTLSHRGTVALGTAMLGMATAPLLVSRTVIAASAEKNQTNLVELATNWEKHLDLSGYAVSEKLDGVRAIWDGKALRFRSGLLINAPRWFVESLPQDTLDGELWMGRGTFDALSGAVRKGNPVDAEWKKITFMVFDSPKTPGTFKQRSHYLQQLVRQSQLPWLKAIDQAEVADAASLEARLAHVAAGGGEGLVLHHFDAPWSAGRTQAVRKLKWQADEEARVIAHIPGTGKYKGLLGALLLQMPNGKTFALGTGLTDAQRTSPPPIGAQVTYRYRDRTPQGLPKFASFLRVRDLD